MTIKPIKLSKLREIFIKLGFVVLIFFSGYYMGQYGLLESRALNISINGRGYDSGITIDRFVSSEKTAEFNLFWEVWDRLKKQYIDHNKLDDTTMIYSAIKGLVNATQDPYTVFLTPEENKKAKDDLGGAFEGVGIQLGYKEYRGQDVLAVISALEGNPAIKAGVKDGDLILEIDGQNTEGMSLPEAVERIRGEKGTTVTLSLLSEGDDQLHETPIVRGTINVPSVELVWITDGSADVTSSVQDGSDYVHLKVNRFGEQTTTEWNKKVREILQHQPPVRGIILDLRGNPGGFFQGAVELGSDLVDSGVIVQQQSFDGTKEQFRASGSARLAKIPLVILVNQGSASASEILAGAVRELRGVKLVGEKTFGKGSVQEALDLDRNTGLHITTYRWLLPSGNSVDKNGIEPDIKVENNQETTEVDEQLQAAIEAF
jgi:carboxyl-terminal processing protease